ncbi:unnamed protein product [Adineta ricciae]|uniref:F-box domain-containing protein n=1 Tax=Adineta ricciae TaxID=249248 RepID=A0A815A1P6_ADIRI|nr:unnamed protein product [Adineta ricciae]CAF1520036.1 unnamed protein product [Adineta ricciae]
MLFEHLPDELLLFAFGYLHKFEIIYGFTKLNQRFDAIVIPYLYEIDLANNHRPYNRHFTLLCQYILPLNGSHVRSVKLAGNKQLQLFRPYICQLVNLKSVIIKDEQTDTFDEPDELYRFLGEVLLMPSLSELSVLCAPSNILKTLSSLALEKLTTVTLFYFQGLYHWGLKSVTRMPQITYLSVNMNGVVNLSELLEITPNVESLHLYFSDMYESEIQHTHVELPRTLKELQVILGHYTTYSSITFSATKGFLYILRGEFESLMLTVINGDKDFADYSNVYSLVENFDHLQTFQYYIETAYTPDSRFSNFEQLPDATYLIYTYPKLNQDCDRAPFNRKYFRSDLNSQLTMRSLYNSSELRIGTNSHERRPTAPTMILQNNPRLTNLKSIAFGYGSNKLAPDVWQYASQVIALSPNLSELKVTYTKNFVKKIYGTVPSKQLKRITYLLVWFEEKDSENGFYPSTFLLDVSRMMPNLKVLELNIGFAAIAVFVTSSVKLIQDARNYFKKVTCVKVSSFLRTAEEKEAIDRYKKCLLEVGERTRTWFYCPIKTESREVSKYRCLYIWL